MLLKKDENYYLQAFFKECKNIEKGKKVVRHVTEDTESFSSNSDEEKVKNKYQNVFW